MRIFKFIIILGLQFGLMNVNASDRLQEIRFILVSNNFELKSDAPVEHVLQLEKSAGRNFSSQEILWAAKGFMESQKSVRPDPKDPKDPKDPPKRSCFTCGMRVLTLQGLERMDQLKIHDRVYSWDEQKNVLVRNEVAEIHSSESVMFGEISPPDGRSALQVTPDHPFYVPRSQTYKPMSEIEPDEELLAIRMISVNCEVTLLPRGPYRLIGRGKVLSITVKRAPHNFIVEGIVVHNKGILH